MHVHCVRVLTLIHDSRIYVASSVNESLTLIHTLEYVLDVKLESMILLL